MADIRWDESVPAGADSVGIGAGEIRSTKSAIRTAVAEEHVFPASSGPAGIHRLGSGRPYVGVQSAVSSSGTDGRMMLASDTSNFFHVGSGGTSFIGGPTVISMGTYPGTVPQRHYWATEMGSQTISGAGAQSVIFPNSGFSGQPYVFLSAESGALAAGQGITLTLTSRTAAGFNFVAVKSGAATSNYTLIWQSTGTRCF